MSEALKPGDKFTYAIVTHESHGYIVQFTDMVFTFDRHFINEHMRPEVLFCDGLDQHIDTTKMEELVAHEGYRMGHWRFYYQTKGRKKTEIMRLIAGQLKEVLLIYRSSYETLIENVDLMVEQLNSKTPASTFIIPNKDNIK